MPHSSFLEWIALDAAYTDEHGRIDADVYAAAEKVWRPAQIYAHQVLTAEPAVAHTLLLKSAARVTRARRRDTQKEINNLPAYLFQTFKRIVQEEREQHANHARLIDEKYEQRELRGLAETVERRLEFEKFECEMDAWTRRVFRLLTLDYTFNDIARFLEADAHVIRNRFNRHIKTILTRRAERERQAAERFKNRAP